MKSLAFVALALAACGGSPPSAPDASPDQDPTPDAAPVATLVYLNFNGETVQPGFESPWTDQSPLVKVKSTVPPLYPTAADRQTQIDAIAAEITATLAPYDIDLVTTRPAAGPYDMIVFGGEPSDLGFDVGISAISDATCNLTPYHLDFVLEHYETSTGLHDMAAAAISMLAFDRGVAYSTAPGDCMCAIWGDGSGPGCTDNAAACTIGGANTPVNAKHTCVGFDTMDEAAQFANAFGAR